MKNWLAALNLILTLKCEHSTRIVSESLDRDLSAVERWAVRLHYISCSSCRRFGEQVRQLRESFRLHSDQVSDQQQLSPDALRRIEDAIRNS